MKFFATVLAGASVVAALGTPTILKKRDPAYIASAIPAISSAAASLDKTVQGLTDANIGAETQPLLAASSQLVVLIQQATANVGTGYTNTDAANLVQPVTSLEAITSQTVNDIIAKKSVFDSGNVGGLVEQQLEAVYSAATALATALVAAVPSTFSSIAQNLATPLLASIENGVTAFKGDTGTGPAGGSGGSTSSTASSPAGSSSSAPPATSSPASSSAPMSSVSSSAPAGSTTPMSMPMSSSSMPPSSTGGSAPISTGAGVANSANMGVAAAALLFAYAL